MTLMEGNNSALQNELATLRQKELQQDEENKQLKERLARAEAEIRDNANNYLTNDPDGNRVGDDNSNTNDISVMVGNSYVLQRQLAALKRKELEQHEENQRLKERLARMEAEMQNNADDDLNYDSSDKESNHENDINYDTEYYTSEEGEEEEEEEKEKEEDENNTAANTQKNKMHDNLLKKYAGHSYNSSDKEDPRNDIYLD
jgi:IS1 family transposase